jgi:hypothetical protein
VSGAARNSPRARLAKWAFGRQATLSQTIGDQYATPRSKMNSKASAVARR